MANYTQPEITRPSVSSSYLDEGGRQIQMSIYNPLFKGNTKEYISYSIMGITASLVISSSERTPTSSVALYSGSSFLLSGSAAFTCGINLETNFTIEDPLFRFESTTFTSSANLTAVDREYDKRERETIKGEDENRLIGVTPIKGRQTSQIVPTKKLEGPLRITTGSIGTTRTGSLRIKQGATLRIIDGVNFTSKYGCTNPNSRNYNPYAVVDDGSCVIPRQGCTDPTAYNYDPGANVDNGSCGWFGCTDPTAINYDSKATINNGACHYAPVGGEVPRQNFYTTDKSGSSFNNTPIDRNLISEVRPKIIIKPNRPNKPNGPNGSNSNNSNSRPVPPVSQKISKNQKFVLNTTGVVYNGPYYSFKRKQLGNSNALLGKKVKGNAPLLIPTEFKSNAILSSRNGDKVYKDTYESVHPNLPPSYNIPTNGGQKCINCVFYKNNNCSKWQAQVRQQTYCVSWLPPELIILAGDTFRLEYPGITQTGFYTKGNEFLLPNNKYYTGNYHILPDGAYKADNSSTVSFGTPLVLKISLRSGPRIHFSKLNVNLSLQQTTQQTQTTTQQTQTINQTTTTSPVTVNSTQTTTQPSTNNASGTGTSYSY